MPACKLFKHQQGKSLAAEHWIDDRNFLMMTENFGNHVCKLGQSTAISITLHMARGRQTSCYGKMKAERY